MSASDQCEPQVIRAFQKDQWKITDEQYAIRVSRYRRYVYADLRLQSLINRSTPNILVVEVKCFPANRSLLDEFHHAIGQYLIYESGLMLKGSAEPLYLAMPSDIYHKSEPYTAIHLTLQRVKIKVVLVDIHKEEIVEWINP